MDFFSLEFLSINLFFEKSVAQTKKERIFGTESEKRKIKVINGMNGFSRSFLICFGFVLLLISIFFFFTSFAGDVETQINRPVSSTESSVIKEKERIPQQQEEQKHLCILPVGDSLTQGVDEYRGYRKFLHQKIINVLHKKIGENGEAAEVTFVGTNAGVCTYGKPQQIWVSPKRRKDLYDEILHEGHCSWSARLLRERLANIITSNSSSQNTELIVDSSMRAFSRVESYAKHCIVSKTTKNMQQKQDDDNDDTVSSSSIQYHLRVDISLLLIGHNNIFQIAKLCKLKELQPIDSQLDESLKRIKEFDSTQEQEVISKMMTTKQQRCAWKNFKSDYFVHLNAMIKKLLIGENSKLIVGLNPPTGFPILDSMIHAIIRIAVANNNNNNNQKRNVIHVATFPRFGKIDGGEKHTFDSTHPNDRGAQILAKGWMKELERGKYFG